MNKFIVAALTLIALIAFAGNSVLARMALAPSFGPLESSMFYLSPVDFTAIRLVSGAITLWVLLKLSDLISLKNTQAEIVANEEEANHSAIKTWIGAASLFLYGITFSIAYVSLDTGTGALILFATVQFSMIAYSWWSGHKFTLMELIGLALALAGFIWLVLPTITSPSLVGLVLMIISGIAWAAYSLVGQGNQNPLKLTAQNFLKTIPFVFVLLLIVDLVIADKTEMGSKFFSTNLFQWWQVSQSYFTEPQVVYALLSGAVTSGIGYGIWYTAIKGISTVQAAVVQLAVPIIAAIGGVIFSNEVLEQRLIVSSIAVVAGILLVILGGKLQKR